jgi:TM2 domain-containing membrane protein YozV
MDTYQYKYGDRPLEGYTIQRAAGRGGFGEVYYAVSDSGRQVALKAVQSYEQIELRGISQCMNLKSPHLVTIFDVKYNDKGRPFVIMEYVSGPALSDLLKESPGGLGTQKAAFFLREIAKGLSYLHECGIVHRDLKPSNIFYENGYVKIGDYGLTKAISASHHVSHTITVGTVHYMAPEIGAGKYDRSVDIYALGILLYEMLTGQVPFLGSSPAEILMKHMTAAPDLSNIEEPFARVIRRALAKDPAERYQTVQEMVEDIFGAEHVRNSVSQFSAEELSVVAEHVAQKVRGPRQQGRPQTPGQARADSDFSREFGKKAEQFARKAEQFARKAEVIGGQMAERFKTAKERAHQIGRTRTTVADPLSPHQRKKLALIAMAATALGAGFLCGHNDDGRLKLALVVFVMIGIASRIIVRSLGHWWTALDHEKRGLGKVGTTLIASFVAVLVGAILSGALGVDSAMWLRSRFPIPFPAPFIHFGPAGFGVTRFLALALPLLLVDWVQLTDSQRQQRIVLGWPILVGGLGLIAGGIFGMNPIVAACTLAGILLVVQTKSSFGRMVAGAPGAAGGSDADVLQTRGVSAGVNEGTPYGAGASGSQRAAWRASRASGIALLVPPWVRPLWLIAWLASVGLGLMLVIMAGVGSMRGHEFAFAVAGGVDLFIFSVLCFIMMLRTTFAGWYRYLVRPVLLTMCAMTTVGASILMGTLNLHNDEAAVVLFFIIFPNIVFLVLLFLPARVFGADNVRGARLPSPWRGAMPSGSVSPCSRTTALILSLIPAIPFLPIAGLQRFYVGKVGTGILWLFTLGLCGIGQLVDFIMILAGSFKDRNGLPVVVWGHAGATETVGSPAAVQAAAPMPQTPETPAAKAEPAVQAAEEKPQPQAYQPPSWPSYGSMGSVYEPWDPIGGLFAAVGHIFALAALLVGLGVGLHMPQVAAAAWPQAQPVVELERTLGPNWPGVAEQVGTALIFVLLFLAAILIMIGRRKSGGLHLVRAILGLAGFFIAIQIFGEVMWGQQIQEVVMLFQQNQAGPALEKLFSAFSQQEAIMAGVIVLVSVLVLSWPPRRRAPVFAPMPHQGVVL